MRLFILSFMLVLTSLAHGAQPKTQFADLDVLQKNKLLGKQKILFREDNTVVIQTESGSPKNLYLVRYPATPERAFGDFAKLGKMVDVRPGLYALMEVQGEENVAELATQVHDRTGACGGLIRLQGEVTLQANGPLAPPKIPTTQADPRITNLVAEVQAENMRTTVDKLSAFFTRYYTTPTGADAARSLQAEYQSLAQGRTDVHVELFTHDWAQSSLVVRIDGTENPSEKIILGSHIDSINRGATGRAPGADDNASGTATNLEVFRILMANGIRPKRTIEIHGYAGEEVGLYGSYDIARKYKDENQNVIAMLQNDMNLYLEPGANPSITFISNNTSADLNRSLGRMVDLYVGIPWANRSFIMGSSDHASWTGVGYHTSFPFEDTWGYNLKIHTADDTIANSGSFEQSAMFTKLNVAFALHYGGISE